MTKRIVVKARDTSENIFRYYTLKPDVMEETDCNGDKLCGELPYSIQRWELSLNYLKAMTPAIIRTGHRIRYWVGETRCHTAIITITSSGNLEIGCHRFSPTQAKKLKEWALR